ncbi:hypothetical protein OUY22_29030 [Nonomuraea sp. MCN248]|uniref:Uncharacterized protein n=1 Tax=Nonomuraea corallina TaxID=2989783 RepID=A0ABT4SJV2_9ACTN|nr:hypothetical protein [Nonomuraea corallina]MDA0637469.1 hypothetical protein [Nonomuraea corallina]
MGSKLKRVLQATAISGIMAGALALPATAAHAGPSNCSSAPYGSNGWWAFCGKGDGTYQAWVRCYRIGTSKYTVRWGQWRSPGGSPSTVNCQSTEEVGGGGYLLS